MKKILLLSVLAIFSILISINVSEGTENMPCSHTGSCAQGGAYQLVCCRGSSETPPNEYTEGWCRPDEDNDGYVTGCHIYPDPLPNGAIKTGSDCRDVKPQGPGMQQFGDKTGGGCTKPGGFSPGGDGSNCQYNDDSKKLCRDGIDQECSPDNLAGVNDCQENFCAFLHTGGHPEFEYCRCTFKTKKYNIGQSIKCSEYDSKYEASEDEPLVYCGISGEEVRTNGVPFSANSEKDSRLSEGTPQWFDDNCEEMCEFTDSETGESKKVEIDETCWSEYLCERKSGNIRESAVQCQGKKRDQVCTKNEGGKPTCQLKGATWEADPEAKGCEGDTSKNPDCHIAKCDDSKYPCGSRWKCNAEAICDYTLGIPPEKDASLCPDGTDTGVCSECKGGAEVQDTTQDQSVSWPQAGDDDCPNHKPRTEQVCGTEAPSVSVNKMVDKVIKGEVCANIDSCKDLDPEYENPRCIANQCGAQCDSGGPKGLGQCSDDLTLGQSGNICHYFRQCGGSCMCEGGSATKPSNCVGQGKRVYYCDQTSGWVDSGLIQCDVSCGAQCDSNNPCPDDQTCSNCQCVGGPPPDPDPIFFDHLSRCDEKLDAFNQINDPDRDGGCAEASNCLESEGNVRLDECLAIDGGGVCCLCPEGYNFNSILEVCEPEPEGPVWDYCDIIPTPGNLLHPDFPTPKCDKPFQNVDDCFQPENRLTSSVKDQCCCPSEDHSGYTYYTWQPIRAISVGG